MSRYVVKPGDTLGAIAARLGVGSWQVLYQHPSNAEFRAKRPNPNLIYPGDIINIPDNLSAQQASPGQKSNYALAIIDGTGPGNDFDYASSMKFSFCRQLGNAVESTGNGRYWRGPGPVGSEVEQEANAAYKYLLNARQADPNTKLMLAGYSRGGSAAIMAAELLERNGNVSVDSLFLFDAVARHLYSGGEIIPANVQFSCHARRDLQLRLVLKYEGTFSDVEVKGISLTNSSNPMRPTFGNTGLTWKGNGEHQKAVAFAGSHGALGGVGWGFVQEDPLCQSQVAAYMNSQLEARGVWHELKSHPPAASTAAIPGAFELISGVTLDALLMLKHRRNLSKSGAAN